jgi:hypothetical protein
MTWFGCIPCTGGKSPVAGSREPTSLVLLSIAWFQTSAFIFFNSIQRDRHAVAGDGETNSSDPETLELGEGEISTAELPRAPPPERVRSPPKSLADRATTSSAPPAGHPEKPTLCTGQGTPIPHPPAAGAAAGGRGIDAPPACEVDLLALFTNRPSQTVAGEGNDQAQLLMWKLIRPINCLYSAL